MRKLLNKPWFVALLAFGAVLFVGQSLLDKRSPSRRGSADSVASTETVDQPDDEADAAPAEGTLAGALKHLVVPDQVPDPFAPRRARTAAEAPETKEQGTFETESLHLSAIWVQDGEVLLFINDRICRPGETLGRITLASVESGGVWLTHWKGRDFLPLGQAFTLVTPAAPTAAPTNATHEG